MGGRGPAQYARRWCVHAGLRAPGRYCPGPCSGPRRGAAWSSATTCPARNRGSPPARPTGRAARRQAPDPSQWHHRPRSPCRKHAAGAIARARALERLAGDWRIRTWLSTHRARRKNGGTTARWSDQDGRWRGWCLADKLQGGGLSEPCRLSTRSGACHRQWFDPSASR